jgi:hypothetical protein
MRQAFILRFQDPCDDSSSGIAATGTATKTKMIREQADADPAKAVFHSLPAVEINAGTITTTRTHREQADSDYGSAARTFPVQFVMGTATKTAVKMEIDDQDPRQHELTVLPRCSSY